MLVFLVASIVERPQASPAAAEIEAYITAQELITNQWERAQDCIFTDAAGDSHTGSNIDGRAAEDSGMMAFVHIPKSS